VAVVGGVAAVLLLAVALSYNRFVSQRQLEGYATHEREVLRSVVEARKEALRREGDDAAVRDAGPPRVETS